MDTKDVKQVLPGIKLVSLAAISSATVEKSYIEGNAYNVSGNFTSLPIAGLCSFSVSSDVVKGQLIYTYQIEGLLFDQKGFTLWGWNSIPVYAKVTDITGSCYLLGYKEKPYATCSIGLTVEDTASGKRCRPLSISFKSPLPLHFCR